MSQEHTLQEMAGNIAMQIIRNGELPADQKSSMSAFDFSFAMAVMTGLGKEHCLDMIMDAQYRIMATLKEEEKSEKELD